MGTATEFRTASYVHAHHLSLRALAWATLAITAVMGGLFFAVGFPPAFDTFYEKMYFHSIGIGIAALLCYLMLATFELEAYEPPVDFPIRYRAFAAVIFAAIGGLFAINASTWTSLPDVGMLFFVISFVLVADVGGALLVELFLLPRKRAGVYEGHSRSVIDYVARLLPLRAEDRAAYGGTGSGYWLAIISLLSAVVAAVIGFINLWVRAFGPSFFSGYMSWLGLDRAGFLSATLDPHSHMIAIAILAGIVAVAVVRFRALTAESRARRVLANAGTWIALVGVVLTTIILGAVAFLNYAPPTLLTSGPNDVNGMAGDDLIMTIAFVGALLVAAAVLADRTTLRSGLRLTILGTWLGALAITVVEGFWIELHESQFGGTLATNDAAFAAAHPMTGIFLMMVLSLGLLIVDAFPVSRLARTITVGVGATGLIAAVLGTTLWTFVDPSTNGPSYVIYVAGLGISYVAVLAAGVALRGIRPLGVVQQRKPLAPPTAGMA